MPEEWPIAAPAADGNGPARPAGRGRLATVRRDFFLHPAERLTEQERALMTAMLNCLVSDVADAVRAALPSGRIAANDEGDATLVTALSAAGLLDEPGLMALLLRRADEERIATAARARSGRREARVLQGLVSHDYGAVAAAAMALILGRGRRRDRFGQCLIAFDDLPDSSAEHLVHAVAAGMRRELATGRGVPAADQELTAASDSVLDGHDPERSVESLTAALVHFLDEGDSLTDELVLAAAHEGEVAFVAGVLARRGGIASDSAMDELLSGDAAHVMALLRVAGASRQLSAGLLGGIGDLLGIADAGEAIGLFDRMTDGEVEAARSWLVTAAGYRTALGRLGQGRG
ncbi:DUF2336 domain-containing protein [Sphingomonas sp.]|uniref:DUF2336 domain-containing protein n=1 Tax=Sphingomonas sp. TaxID=28214 RepID=UPI0038AC24CF